MRCRALLLLALTALAACGTQGDGGGGDRPAAAEQRARLAGADRPRAEQFPRPRRGEDLEELAARLGARGAAQVGLATTVLTPGERRVAFGVIDGRQRFVYGPTALYVARGDGRVSGPLPAPADLLVTEPAFRSRQAVGESDPFAAVYAARVRFARPGAHRVLVVTRRGPTTFIGATRLRVRPRGADRVPDVGDRAPAVATDTAATAPGDPAALDTRVPPAPELHADSLRDVLGRRPVALLFATPQLCSSRVCGPVVDLALQLRERYGDRIAFIHQEVYAGNDPARGVREPLRRFGLRTEPWLFTIGRDGRIAARLEGSFGLEAFERALRAALERT